MDIDPGDQGGCVGSDGKEARLAHRDLPRVAHEHAEAQGYQGIICRHGELGEVEGNTERLGDKGDADDEEDEDADGQVFFPRHG
jgi:hypothetical protein